MNLFDQIMDEAVPKAPAGGAMPPPAAPASTGPSLRDSIMESVDLAPPAAAQPAPPKPETPEAEPSWSDIIARHAKIAGSYGLKGALGTLGLPGTFAEMTGKAVQDYVSKPIINSVDALLNRAPKLLPPPNNPLSSENLQTGAKSLGLTDRPDLEPKTASERYTAATAEGTGGALPLGIGSAPMALRAMVQGAAGGAAGEAAAEAFPKLAGAARAIGNVAGGIAGNTGVNIGSRLSNMANGKSIPMLEAYRTADVKPRLAGDVTGDEGLQWAQATGMKLPGGAGIERAARETVDDFGRSVEKQAKYLGSSTTPQQAGTAIQKAGEDWLSNWKSKSEQAWDAVRAQIPPTTKVDVGAYRNALDDVTRAMPDAPETAAILQSAYPKALKSALGADLGRTGTELSWQSVSKIRSLIGEKLADPGLVADATTAELKRLYGALTEDMRVAVAMRGPKAVDAFDKANAVTRSGHEFIDGTLSKMVGSKDRPIDPEKAYSWLLGSAEQGGSRLAATRAEMPAAVDEAAATKLRQMAEPSPGQATPSLAYSPAKFLTEWKKLAPEAQDALLADPDVRKKVEALTEVAGSMKETARRLNTSNTTPAASWKDVVQVPIVGAATGGATSGVPGAVAGFLGGLGLTYGPGMAARLLTASPALTRYLATPAASAELPRLTRLLPILGGARVPMLPSP